MDVEWVVKWDIKIDKVGCKGLKYMILNKPGWNSQKKKKKKKQTNKPGC